MRNWLVRNWLLIVVLTIWLALIVDAAFTISKEIRRYDRSKG